MKRYLFPLIAVVFSIFATSCGDNPIVNVNEVQKSDLTSPLFLSFDNTLDKPTKKVWSFNNTEAVKGTITIVDDDILRISTEWYFNSWSLSGIRLTLNDQDGDTRTYDLSQVSILGYNAIGFGTTYVCIPSSNKGIDGTQYEQEWFSRGLTVNALWDAYRMSYSQRKTVDIKLNK